MKLSELKDGDALEVYAELLDPVTKIAVDKEFQELYNSNKPYLLIIKHLLKNHKDETMEILAIVNGKKKEEFHANFWEIPKMIKEIWDDANFQNLFQLQQMTNSNDTSSVAMENTKEAGKI